MHVRSLAAVLVYSDRFDVITYHLSMRGVVLFFLCFIIVYFNLPVVQDDHSLLQWVISSGLWLLCIF